MWSPVLLILLAECLMPAIANGDGRTPIDAALAAKLPAPGTVVPGAIAWTTDGRAVTYLKAEGNTLARALWKADRDGDAPPAVIARAPGDPEGEALSREEELRRERQRLTATGLAQVVPDARDEADRLRRSALWGSPRSQE